MQLRDVFYVKQVTLCKCFWCRCHKTLYRGQQGLSLPAWQRATLKLKNADSYYSALMSCLCLVHRETMKQMDKMKMSDMNIILLVESMCAKADNVLYSFKITTELP